MPAAYAEAKEVEQPAARYPEDVSTHAARVSMMALVTGPFGVL
jgi:hypothetical protein